MRAHTLAFAFYRHPPPNNNRSAVTSQLERGTAMIPRPNPVATTALLALALATALLAWDSPTAQAFEIDTHYDVTFAIALADSWSWDDARVIASADQGVDQNANIVADLIVNPFRACPDQPLPSPPAPRR